VALLAVFVVAGSLVVIAHGARRGDATTSSEATATATTAARLLRVVDGDTVRVRTHGHDQPVRLIGIDTPETHRPGRSVECGGPQATAHLKALLVPGERVKLVADRTQDARDRYHRRLAYLLAGRGRDVGQAQLQAGWATVYLYHHPFARVRRYRRAQARAHAARRGIYAACRGHNHRT
jgi:micrococcal nuclease